MLRMYDRQLKRYSSLICYSDPGSRYVSVRYAEQLGEAGIEPSVGSKSDVSDNALAKTISGLYKADLIYRRALEDQGGGGVRDARMSVAVQPPLPARTPWATPRLQKFRQTIYR